MAAVAAAAQAETAPHEQSCWHQRRDEEVRSGDGHRRWCQATAGWCRVAYDGARVGRCSLPQVPAVGKRRRWEAENGAC